MLPRLPTWLGQAGTTLPSPCVQDCQAILCAFHPHRSDETGSRFPCVGLPRFRRHISTVQVNYHGQIQPALLGADVRDVGDPDLIWQDHRELTLQSVGCCCSGLACFVAWTFVATYGTQSGLLHQACNPLLPAQNPFLSKITVYAWAAVDAVAVFKGLLDALQQGFIGQGAGRLGACFPSVIATALNA